MACDPQSGWLTAIQVGATALSPIIAVIGGWIAWQQVRINRNKLKLDRFDKRFEVHEAAMTFVAKVCTSGNASVEELNEFLAKTRGSRFLLSQEIADYLNEIHNKAGHLQSTTSVMQSLALTEEWRKKYADKWLELTEWLQQQLTVIPDKFAPFLSVEDI
jgi:2-succinyl-5-enolpyruvyl-6-hydroxy-3-cyclohexene-1-carboxylate synthase